MKAIATDLCNNILERGFKENITITPMKLQKLLYYVCRDYVRQTGEMPIGEQFEVWQYGPVLISVYGEFKDFGKKPINTYSKNANGHSRKVSEENNPLLASVIDVVWAKYKRLNGMQLSQITHQVCSGWAKAYREHREVITVDDMISDKSE